MELSDGTTLFDTDAMLNHISRSNPEANLTGTTVFEGAKVNEWMGWCQNEWLPKMHGPLMPLLGFGPPDQKKFTEGVKVTKELAKVFNNYLNGNNWIAGKSMTIADLYVGTMFMLSFQTVFDDGFRKAMPHLTKWF